MSLRIINKNRKTEISKNDLVCYYMLFINLRISILLFKYINKKYFPIHQDMVMTLENIDSPRIKENIKI